MKSKNEQGKLFAPGDSSYNGLNGPAIVETMDPHRVGVEIGDDDLITKIN